MHIIRIGALSTLVLSLSVGCLPKASVAPLQPPRNVGAAAIVRKVTTLTGFVNAPASVLANNGATLVSDKGVGLIGNNAGGLVSKVKYGVAAVETWNPVPNARVVVVDAFGRPYPGVGKVETDELGQFKLSGVPVGITLVLEVQTSGPRLSTLFRTVQGGDAVPVDPATTVVTESLRSSFANQQGALNQVSMDSFAQLTEEVKQVLLIGKVAIDLSSPAATAATMENAVATNEKLRAESQQIIKATEKATQEAVQSGRLKADELNSPPPLPAPSQVASSAPQAPPASSEPTALPSDALTVEPSVTPSAVASVLPAGPRSGTVLASYETGTDPCRIAFDPSGNVWVVNRGSYTVGKYSAAGAELGTYPTQFTPSAIAFDTLGQAWITNRGSSSLWKLSADGVKLGDFATANTPTRVAVGAGGTVWVTNFNGQTVTRYGADGTQLGSTPIDSNPEDLVVDSAGNAWVLAWATRKVFKISPTGSVLGNYVVGEKPKAIAVATDGTFWIANNGDNSLHHLDVNGALLKAFMLLSAPESIAMDPAGIVWLTHSASGALSRFDPSTETFESFTISDVGNLTHVAVDRSGTLWVTHNGNQLVKVAR